MVKLYQLFFIGLTLIGCSSEEYLSPDELKKFIADEQNGLVQKAESNGYAIQVSYRPTDLWIYQEAHGLVLDSAQFKSINSKYSDYYYFILSLSKNQHEALEGGMTRYSDLVQTLSFRMSQYVNLTTSARDTIPTGDFIIDRTYGLNDATNLLFVFHKEKAKGQEWVQFNLNEF